MLFHYQRKVVRNEILQSLRGAISVPVELVFSSSFLKYRFLENF